MLLSKYHADKRTKSLIKNLIIFSICYLFTTILYGQSGRTLVQNAPASSEVAPVINVKWYSEQFWYPEGVNLYRKEVGTGDNSWVKLNTSPITKRNSVSQTALDNDDDLDAFVEMMNEDPSQAEGFLLISLFVKTFQSPDFSRFMGIQYDDASAQWGKSYQYEVRVLKKGAEEVLSDSKVVVCGPYNPLAPVDNFQVKLEEHTANFFWKEEEARFYGTNMYRWSSLDDSRKKLNINPIVLSDPPEESGADPSRAMYKNDSLQEGVTYYYQIAGTDFFGGETQLSEIKEVVVQDVTPPNQPYNLLRKIDTLNVQVSWEVVPTEDLIGFNIYRSTFSEGPFELVNEGLLSNSDTVYFGTVPQPGNYYYVVSAVDKADNEARSLPLFVEVQDNVAPSPPQNVIIKADTGQFILSWDPSPEPDVNGYLLFRTVNKNDKKNFVLLNGDVQQETTFVQTLPKNARNSFLYKIIAVDTAYNRSEPSEIVKGILPDVTPPIKPFIKSAVSVNDSVTISWLKNPERDLAKYELYQSKDDSLWTSLRFLDPSVNILTYTNSYKGAKKLYYRIQAIDSADNKSEFSNIISVAFGELPANGNIEEIKLKYQRRQNRIKVSWESSSEQIFNGFIVYRGTDGKNLRPISGLLKKTEYNDSNLPKGKKYTYELRAYHQNGEVIRSKKEEILIDDK